MHIIHIVSLKTKNVLLCTVPFHNYVNLNKTILRNESYMTACGITLMQAIKFTKRLRCGMAKYCRIETTPLLTYHNVANRKKKMPEG